MLGALISLLVIAVVGFVVLTVLLAIFGALFGLAVGLLTLAVTLAMKILPVVLVGWLVVKLLQRSGRPRVSRSRTGMRRRAQSVGRPSSSTRRSTKNGLVASLPKRAESSGISKR